MERREDFLSISQKLGVCVCVCVGGGAGPLGPPLDPPLTWLFITQELNTCLLNVILTFKKNLTSGDRS